MTIKSQTQSGKLKAQLARRKAKVRKLKHKESQRRYREKNKEALREQARLKMKQHRADVKASEERTQMAAELRRDTDTDYRERKYMAKFGEKAFKELYLPLYRMHGNQTFKFKIVWADESPDENRERILEDGSEAAQLLAESKEREAAAAKFT
ncbi:hypothetical protein C8R43DRAFT_963325 [Mycena crocata]|nr:hypothetical protein C8R43DRAFT_963325 [Mycena crocata]